MPRPLTQLAVVKQEGFKQSIAVVQPALGDGELAVWLTINKNPQRVSACCGSVVH